MHLPVVSTHRSPIAYLKIFNFMIHPLTGPLFLTLWGFFPLARRFSAESFNFCLIALKPLNSNVINNNDLIGLVDWV